MEVENPAGPPGLSDITMAQNNLLGPAEVQTSPASVSVSPPPVSQEPAGISGLRAYSAVASQAIGHNQLIGVSPTRGGTSGIRLVRSPGDSASAPLAYPQPENLPPVKKLAFWPPNAKTAPNPYLTLPYGMWCLLPAGVTAVQAFASFRAAFPNIPMTRGPNKTWADKGGKRAYVYVVVGSSCAQSAKDMDEILWTGLELTAGVRAQLIPVAREGDKVPSSRPNASFGARPQTARNVNLLPVTYTHWEGSMDIPQAHKDVVLDTMAKYVAPVHTATFATDGSRQFTVWHLAPDMQALNDKLLGLKRIRLPLWTPEGKPGREFDLHIDSWGKVAGRCQVCKHAAHAIGTPHGPSLTARPQPLVPVDGPTAATEKVDGPTVATAVVEQAPARLIWADEPMDVGNVGHAGGPEAPVTTAPAEGAGPTAMTVEPALLLPGDIRSPETAGSEGAASFTTADMGDIGDLGSRVLPEKEDASSEGDEMASVEEGYDEMESVEDGDVSDPTDDEGEALDTDMPDARPWQEAGRRKKKRATVMPPTKGSSGSSSKPKRVASQPYTKPSLTNGGRGSARPTTDDE